VYTVLCTGVFLINYSLCDSAVVCIMLITDWFGAGIDADVFVY